MKLAIFDFDGTIYKKETFTLLMKALKKQYPKRYRTFFMRILPVYIGYKLKLVKETSMKAHLMERYMHAFDDVPEKEITHFFAEVAQEMERDFHQGVIQRLRIHQKEGYQTLILSGAFTPLLCEVDKLLKLNCDVLIGTDFCQTGEAFRHIHAEQKAIVLQDYFMDEEIDWKVSYAYGDSASDLAVLERVGHPVAVAPDDALKQIAHTRDWEIILNDEE